MSEHRVPSVPGAFGGHAYGHSGPSKGGDPEPKLGGELEPLVDRALLSQDLIDRVGSAVMIYTVDRTGYGELTRAQTVPDEAVVQWLRAIADGIESGTVVLSAED